MNPPKNRFLCVSPKVILGTKFWEILLFMQHSSTSNTLAIYMTYENFWFFLSSFPRIKMLCPMKNNIFFFLVSPNLNLFGSTQDGTVEPTRLWCPDMHSAALGGLALDCSYFIALLWCSPLGEVAMTCLWAHEIFKISKIFKISRKIKIRTQMNTQDSLGGTFIIMYHVIVSN